MGKGESERPFDSSITFFAECSSISLLRFRRDKISPVKLKSLSDLHQLLPDSPQPSRITTTIKHDGKGKTVHIFLETKGRKGKTVTIVSGLQHNPTTMKEIASMLKEHSGTGGTVKDGNIELQGDQRRRATEELQKMRYLVK